MNRVEQAESPEQKLIEQWAPLINRLARTQSFVRLGMTEDDVRSDLQIALLREYRRQHGRMTPMLAKTVIDRRATVLRRNNGAGYRKLFQIDPIAKTNDGTEVDWTDRVPDGSPTAEDSVIAVASDARTRAIVEALRARLRVREYTMLHLCFVEGLSTREIARLSGQETADVARSLRSAKTRARELLKALGVDTMEEP